MRIGIYLGQRATGDHGEIDFGKVYDGRALNGSEASAINLARGLAERGHEVHLFCAAATQNMASKDLAGVRVWWTVEPIVKGLDVHIAVSEPGLLAKVDGGLRVAWHHLIDFPDGFDASYVDVYVCVSPAHLRELCERFTVVALGRSTWLPNSINLELFDTKLPRRPHTMAWISSPDRGLHRLLELWPRIRARVPTATLRIYYRIDPWLDMWAGRAGDSPFIDRANYIKQCLAVLGRDGETGITVMGAVSWRQFAAELSQTAAVPYTFDPIDPWSELFCIALVDACAAGAAPITSDLDVLGANFEGIAEIIPGRPGEHRQQWEDAIVRALTDDVWASGLRGRTRPLAQGLSRQRVAEAWEAALLARGARLAVPTLRAFAGVPDPYERAEAEAYLEIRPSAPAPATAPALPVRNTNVTTDEFCGLVLPYLRRTPRLVLDVGAMDGTDAAILKRNYPDAQVIAIEGLHENVQPERWPGVEWIEAVVAGADGPVGFHVKGQNGIHGIYPHAEVPTREVRQAAGVTLATLLRTHGLPAPDVIKLDVEGAAWDVLTGLGPLLADVQALHVEVETREWFPGQRLEPEVSALLRAHGFTCILAGGGADQSQLDAVWVKAVPVTEPRIEVSRPKLVYVYGQPEPDTWRDGMWAAMKLLGSDTDGYDVTWVNAQLGEAPPAEGNHILLAWGDFGSPAEAACRHLRARKKALQMGGMSAPTDPALCWDVIFAETAWHQQYLRQKTGHGNVRRAFGVNTDIYRPFNITKRFQWITVGHWADWKRQHLFHSRPGLKIAVGERYATANPHQAPPIIAAHLRAGVIVAPYVSPEDLSILYNLSERCYIPASLVGGGERAVLEAKACKVPVEIEPDNPKLRELLVGPVISHYDFAKALKEGLNA